jgi:putative endopeptidase
MTKTGRIVNRLLIIAAVLVQVPAWGADSLPQVPATNTAIPLAYRAFRRAHPMGHPASSDDLAVDRHFFEAFCTHRRAKYRDQLLFRILASDGHPPQQYRCNGPLSNFAPFVAAFDVKPGDGMFREPSERVAIW